MRSRLLFIGTAATAYAVLTACSSSPSFTPTPPGPTPTSAPTVTLNGTETQKFTYAYGYPTTQPPITIRTSVKQIVSTFATTPPSGLPQAATDDVFVSETDATQLQTVQSKSDTYVATQGSSVFAYSSIAEIAGPPSGQSTAVTTIYKSPQQIIDQTSGATWTNSPGSTIDEKYSDGHYEDRTIANTGTYTEVGTAPGSNGTFEKIKIDERASGAGTYAGPFLGYPPSFTWSFSAPAGSPMQITLKLLLEGKKLEQTALPAWYAPPPAFFAEKDSSQATTAPSSCGKAAGANVLAVTRQWARLDTVIGYVETTKETAWYVPSGPLCVNFSDETDSFYDWQGDQPYTLVFSGNAKPLAKIVTNEALSATSVPASPSAMKASALHAAPNTAIAPSIAIAGAEAQFFGKLERQRANLRDAMIHYFAVVKGGSK